MSQELAKYQHRAQGGRLKQLMVMNMLQRLSLLEIHPRVKKIQTILLQGWISKLLVKPWGRAEEQGLCLLLG